MTAIAAILVLMLASADETRADAPVAPPAEATEPGGEALFRQAVAAYDASDYKRAIELFSAAHRLSKAPEILFDIAQAYRAMGDCRKAVEHFDAFIAAAPADDPLLAKAKTRRRDLAPCSVADAPLPKVDRTATVRESTALKTASSFPLVALEQRPAEQVPASAQRTVCTAAAGSTLALAATGLGLGLAAWIKAADVEDRRIWDQDAQRDDARGHAFADASVATLVAAGIAGVVAGTSCWLSWRAEHARRAP